MNIKGKFFFVSFYLCSHLNCWWIQSLDIYWAVHSMPVSLKIEFLAKASNVWHIVRKIHMFSLSIFKAWKFRCPFSPYSVTISVSPRQGTYWETNVCAGRIILHPNLSSDTALQQDSVICKVGWKHFMMNFWLPCTLPIFFFICRIMSEINATEHKSICCSPFSAR